MPKSRVRVMNEMSAEEAAELISHIALGIATGEIWIEGDDSDESLHPGRSIAVDIKGGEGREQGKLNIDIKWKTNLRIMGQSVNGDGVNDSRKEEKNGQRRKRR